MRKTTQVNGNVGFAKNISQKLQGGGASSTICSPPILMISFDINFNLLFFKFYVGVSTNEIDYIARQLIIQHGAYPSPLGYRGFPKSICTSVNNVVVHGIPDR